MALHVQPLALRSTCWNGWTADLLAFWAAESAHEIDDEADQQNQAKTATADDGTAKVKSAAAEQEEQDNDEK